MNKEAIIITQSVIDECLCESFEIVEKTNPSHNKSKETMN